MADPPVYSTPGWVKLVGIIALILALVIGVVLITGVGGEHSPGRHMPSRAASSEAPFLDYRGQQP